MATARPKTDAPTGQCGKTINPDPVEGHIVKKFINHFRKDEDGAVTVDWVVLTAAVIALAGVAYGAISTGTQSISDKVHDALDDTNVTPVSNAE